MKAAVTPAMLFRDVLAGSRAVGWPTRVAAVPVWEEPRNKQKDI